MINVTLCPTGIDHGEIRVPSRAAVQGRKKLVILKLEMRQYLAVGNERSVVVRFRSGPDLIKHISRDCRVVDITSRLTFAKDLKQGQGERITHGVDVNVGATLCQSLIAQDERSEGLVDKCKSRVRFGFHPLS